MADNQEDESTGLTALRGWGVTSAEAAANLRNNAALIADMSRYAELAAVDSPALRSPGESQ